MSKKKSKNYSILILVIVIILVVVFMLFRSSTDKTSSVTPGKQTYPTNYLKKESLQDPCGGKLQTTCPKGFVCRLLEETPESEGVCVKEVITM